MEPSKGTTQLKGSTFVKMGIVDNFPGYAQKHIGRKVKKEEPQSAGEQQLEQVQPQFVDPEFGHHLSKLRGSKVKPSLNRPNQPIQNQTPYQKERSTSII